MATRGMSKAELNQQMALALKKAVDYTVEQIQEENWHKVMEIVYDAYFPSDYDRTYEFADKAWDTESSSTTKANGANAKGEFKYSPKNMISSSPQHASFLNGEDSREYLAEIIYQGLAGDFTGEYTYAHENPAFNNAAWTRKRDAWKALNDWLGKNNLKKIFSEGLTKAGLQYHSHSTPIKRTIT